MSEVRPAAWKYKHPHGEIMFSQSGAVAKLTGLDAQPLYSEANLAQAVADERARCAKEVPTTWLDPLLTGPNAALPDGYQYTPKDLERLLRAIRDRILATPKGE